ncbi:TetR/AcrR family transcriptional regulator [bacterium]|nr:TetR/AcrR family transcriptional regulator [bacterium]
MDKALTKNNGETLSRSALRRQREREERYQTILKAAETLFVKEGYHQTSINKIADLAEVSVGTVYFYFKNKEDLLIQLLDEISYLFRSRIGAEFRNADSTLEGFTNAGNMFFDEFCNKYPEKVAIMYRESVGQSPLVEEHRKKLHDKSIKDISEALQRMSENMGFQFPSSMSIEIIAVSIMGIYQSIASHFLVSREKPENLKQIGDDAVNYLVGGIKDMCGLN